MQFKFVFLLVAVLCASSAQADVFDKIKDVLDHVKERVADMDAELTDILDSLQNKIETVARAKSNAWHETIKEAVKEAAKQGVDVTECIAEENQIEPILEKFSFEARECFSSEKSTVLEIQKQLNALLEETDVLLEKARVAVAPCEGLDFIAHAKCLASATGPLIPEVGKLALNATKTTGKVVLAIHNANVKIGSCVASSLSVNGKAAEKIVSDATTCIREKIDL